MARAGGAADPADGGDGHAGGSRQGVAADGGAAGHHGRLPLPAAPDHRRGRLGCRVGCRRCPALRRPRWARPERRRPPGPAFAQARLKPAVSDHIRSPCLLVAGSDRAVQRAYEGGPGGADSAFTRRRLAHRWIHCGPFQVRAVLAARAPLAGNHGCRRRPRPGPRSPDRVGNTGAAARRAGIMVEPLFNAFATAAFFEFVTFAIFEMRYLLSIWRARRGAALDAWAAQVPRARPPRAARARIARLGTWGGSECVALYLTDSAAVARRVSAVALRFTPGGAKSAPSVPGSKHFVCLRIGLVRGARCGQGVCRKLRGAPRAAPRAAATGRARARSGSCRCCTCASTARCWAASS